MNGLKVVPTNTIASVILGTAKARMQHTITIPITIKLFAKREGFPFKNRYEKETLAGIIPIGAEVTIEKIMQILQT